ncbi:sugar phosphate isomerase/epimerase family protein [Paenibacillus sp. MBLB4367]|uniref:sugar phosphate isomerase/epimerase family protein n=1 Tax=Paenibacillus sp. MBLB4367 TaxID=3384767 RepID=UPI003907F0C5
MKLGMPSLIEYGTLEENAALCRELELDFIELNMNLPICMPESLPSTSIRFIREQYGIDFTIHLPEELDLSSFHPAIRKGHVERCKESLIWASEAGIRTLNMHLNTGIYFTLPHEKVWINESFENRFAELLEESCTELYPLAESYGIELCIENTCNFHIPFVRRTIDRLARQFRPFSLTWDAGHDAKTNFQEQPVFEAYNDRIRHMHLHDFNGKSDHLPLFTGHVPIRERLRLAEENNISVVIEVKTSEALKQSIRLLRNND